jgi:hypothetical protein
MAVNTLESLVLRGVAVLVDGSALNLRRGPSVQTGGTPAIGLSARHPSPGCAPMFGQPALWPIHAQTPYVDKATTGAGRSRRCRNGVSRRHNPARSAGRTIRLGWSAAKAAATWGERKS